MPSLVRATNGPNGLVEVLDTFKHIKLKNFFLIDQLRSLQFRGERQMTMLK